MSTKHVFIVGFLLFAMFFGAGNLIFPPALGFISGEYFWWAIIGFVLTGVGLPLIGVIVGSISKEGYKESLKAIHPAFAVLMLVTIYLAIGPFFAIPRTATTAYEMGIIPYIENPGGLSLLLFSSLYFGIVFALGYRPGSIVDSIGRVLTPAFLLLMLFLIITAIFMYATNSPNPVSAEFNTDAPLAVGFTQGYLTMDAIAAIAFSVIVLNSIRSLGITSRKELLYGTIKSAFFAAALLAFIYISLGWLGNHVDLGGATVGEQYIGTFLLTYISADAYGHFGTLLLGGIVLIACLTTAAGLVVAVSEYFNSILPKVPYRVFLILFTLISFGLANQGLEQVISTSVPVLYIIYPVAMTSIFLLILTYFLPSPRLALQIPAALVVIVSILATIHRNGWADLGWMESLPLFSSQVEWIPLFIIGYAIGYVAGMKNERVKYT